MKRDYLNELHATSFQAIQTLFGKDFATKPNVVKEENLPSFRSPFISQIGLCNKKYQLCILLGFDSRTVNETFAEVLHLASDPSEKQELAKSTLGELANTIACDLAVKKIILNDFGVLTPTRPLIWETNGILPDFWEATGISGALICSDLEICTHFSYLEQKSLIKDPTQVRWAPTKSLSIFDPHQK